MTNKLHVISSLKGWFNISLKHGENWNMLKPCKITRCTSSFRTRVLLCFVCLPKVYLKAPEESGSEDDDDPFRPSASRPMGSTSLRSSKSAKSLRPGGSSGEIIRKDSTCSHNSSRSEGIFGSTFRLKLENKRMKHSTRISRDDWKDPVLCSYATGPKFHSNFGQGQCTGPKAYQHMIFHSYSS